MKQRLRIFVSSPGDVTAAREIAALTIERLAQEYARLIKIEAYLWEFEAMVASGHFQDSIEPPSAFEVVVLILWSRLGTHLPERTAVREYRGMDGRAPLTGTEWEFEEAFHAAKRNGAPDLLVYRSLKPALFDTHDPARFEQQSQQLKALNGFWERHFANQGMFIGAYTSFTSDAEFATALENHLRKLVERRIAALVAAQGDTASKVWSQAPFRGLEAYEFEHAPIFFGQDEALAKAMLQLTANAGVGSPFLLVLGASGSGKSSLVKAGILPKLFVPRRISGTAFLRRVIFRPSDAQDGEDLFDALARRLTTQASEQEGLSELLAHGQSIASLSAHLRNATAAPAYPIEMALGQLTAQARQSGRMLEYETAKLVLVVDQLEELFSVERMPHRERVQFIELLNGLVRSGLIWVVATMRKDFWHRADETPELVRLSEGNGRLELLPPRPSQLSQMIRRPAEAAGIHFEMHSATDVALNDVISEEVAREPSALPLLSYLLDQLYRTDVLETQGSTLTYASYERLGKLEGAVATQAEAVLKRCAPEDRAALGSVMFSLVDMGTAEGNVERAIARRVPLSTFQPGTPQRRLVEALLDTDARLLVSGTEKGGTPTVRVAHEALITRWAQARDFVQSNAEALKVRHRIEERYALWCGLVNGSQATHSHTAKSKVSRKGFASLRARFGREHGLLTDIDLTDGRRLLKEHRTDTEDHLVAYIQRSIEENQRIRTRSLRVLAAVALIVTVLAIVASGAGWVASRKQHEAEQRAAETLKAQSRLLVAAAAQRLKDSDIAGAQGIILEVLTNPGVSTERTPAAISVFQEIRAADHQLAVLSGHANWVHSAAYSPDGNRIVTASTDKTARIWDARTGIQLVVLSGHSKGVRTAAYSPDGRYIVTASGDKTARIWDALTGTQLTVLSGHVDAVLSAAYSPDGTHIVTASNDKTARIWDVRTGAQLVILSGHVDAVFSAAYSPDGNRIVTASQDKTGCIWDVHTGAKVTVLSGNGDVVFTAAYSPDGAHIVTASNNKSARIWDARTGTQLAVLDHPEAVYSAAYSPDGTRIITSSYDDSARIWDARTAAQLAILSGHTEEVFTAAYSPDGARIVTASSDMTARTWDGRVGGQLTELSDHGTEIYSAAYSPDGTRIVTASLDKTARVLDARTGAQLAELKGHGDSIDSAAYSPDGTRIVTASDDNTARVWDARTGIQVETLAGHGAFVDSAAYSPDGAHIVTTSWDKTARIWDAHSGAQFAVLSGHSDRVNSAAYSPDGTRIVTASSDQTARIWDSRTGIQLVALSGHSYRVYRAAYSPDGARIVTASGDSTARIWDARTDIQLAVLSGHVNGDAVYSAAYSPDGTRIVTASQDKTARIWDAHTGAQLAVLSGHTDQVFSAAYSPDGTRIVTASSDKTARVWDAHVLADVATQIMWDASAFADLLADVERTQLGIPADSRVKSLANRGSPCDKAAAAFYDPERRSPGIVQANINAEIAYPACLAQIANPKHAVQMDYQMGRALLAKRDVKGARQQFELAASRGSRVVSIDLAKLLLDKAGGMLDPGRATILLELAWRDNIPIAAFELGHLYENGARGSDSSPVVMQPDLAKAWQWYQKGADMGEPNALARFAERDERRALAELDPATRGTLLLHAFSYYTAAAERAHDEDWPDNAWRQWRYRRATLARLLEREGMMQQVADAYQTVRVRWAPQSPTGLQVIRTKLHL